jgi:hypothetical protein
MPGHLDQHLRRDAAKVMKGSFQTVKPCALAFMAKSRDKPTPGVAKGRNEQKNPDDLATDRSPRRAEVDLQLPPGSVSNRTQARCSASSSRRKSQTVRSTVRRLTRRPCSRSRSWRTTSALPRCCRSLSQSQASSPSKALRRFAFWYGTHAPRRI